MNLHGILIKLCEEDLKWIVFTLISLHIAHTFIGYFVGPRELLQMSLHSPSENLGLFITVMILSGIFLLTLDGLENNFALSRVPMDACNLYLWMQIH
jgi:hypothetical protein